MENQKYFVVPTSVVHLISIKELASFANGLSKDIDAIENAVASELSNGFVEGTNSKLKMIKRTMYGLRMNLVAAKITSIAMRAKESVKDAIIECNAWFLVLLAVLMVLAFTIYAGLQIWCIVYKGKTFTGNWKWSTHGVSVKAECK